MPGEGARLGGGYDRVQSPGELFTDEGVFVPYTWRDPARLTPGREAELREWDRLNQIEDERWQASIRGRQREARRRQRQQRAS